MVRQQAYQTAAATASSAVYPPAGGAYPPQALVGTLSLRLILNRVAEGTVWLRCSTRVWSSCEPPIRFALVLHLYSSVYPRLQFLVRRILFEAQYSQQPTSYPTNPATALG